jgi:hypothetical protein
MAWRVIKRTLKTQPRSSIKDDYRTLICLEDVNVVDLYADIDEDQDDDK